MTERASRRHKSAPIVTAELVSVGRAPRANHRCANYRPRQNTVIGGVQLTPVYYITALSVYHP